MKAACPSCGAEMDLDVLLAHEDSRQAMARLAQISLPLGTAVLKYLRLFKPAKRAMSHSRTVALIEELLPDMERQAITRKGRDWACPRDAWRAAFEKMFEARDAGKLSLPLTTHGYLYEVLAGLADKVEGQAERSTEAQRRSRAHEGGLQAVGSALAAAAAPAAPPPAVPFVYTGPSRAALKLQAEIAARQAARAPSSNPTAGGSHDPSQ